MMCDLEFRVIIVGGGIAGLAAAIALRGENRQILVLEQSAQLHEIGAAISLQPNASKIVEDWWGLKQSLQARSSSVDQGFRVYQADGKIVKNIALDTMGKYGGCRMIYHRQDLQDVLKEAAMDRKRPGPPVKILTSKHVIYCNPEAGIVTTADGAIFEADIIVGADGIKSRLREFILGRKQTAVPTGTSAYRFLVPMEHIESQHDFTRHINPREEYTTMVLCHDRRLVMGPVRRGKAYSVVALVPDQKMNEDSSDTSWTSSGSTKSFLDAFSVLPSWLLDPFRKITSMGLWQLRDMDPLETWLNGRAILVGDAAHAMLPTQGQGASQAVEDAEALGAFFSDIKSRPSLGDVQVRLAQVFKARHERATLIQQYSRQQARPATEEGSMKVKMQPDEFAEFNYSYNGARQWLARPAPA